MGQKVNPISMRLQVNKNWRSKWFANKREYAQYLVADPKFDASASIAEHRKRDTRHAG